MILHPHHLHHQAAVNMEIVFGIARDWASWVDLVALSVVFILALKSRNKIKSLVLFEFAMVFCVHELLVYFGWYSSNVLTFIYAIGLKDVLMAAVLFLIGANAILITAYALAGAYCILVWISYHKFYNLLFLDLYYLRGSFVTLMMLIQVYGLTRNGGIRHVRRTNPIKLYGRKASGKGYKPVLLPLGTCNHDNSVSGSVRCADADIDRIARAFSKPKSYQRQR
jgi:hypothetical protein